MASTLTCFFLLIQAFDVNGNIVQITDFKYDFYLIIN